jgi:hypothetical protein
MSSALNCGSVERLIIAFLLFFYKTEARVLFITKGMAKKAPGILHEPVSACSHTERGLFYGYLTDPVFMPHDRR